MRGEALCLALRDEGKVPDCVHGAALDDEEEDLGGVGEAGEDEEGEDEGLEEGGDAAIDDAQDGQAD